MSSLKHVVIFFIFITLCQATTFSVQNNCSYTVWAAAVPGGGARLNQGRKWVVNSTGQGRLWARTNCKFNGSGHGRCESGDCNGLLECRGNGAPPVTLAEYSLSISGMDYINISLVDGYNVPVEFKSESTGCVERVECVGDINRICPTELRDPGGCHNPCSVFNNNQFCCFTGRCGPTVYSNMFKEMCPDASTYPKDDATKQGSCPAGSDYTVVFCPSVSADVPTIDILNNCSYTVWAAAMAGGGRRLDTGTSWSIQANPGTNRIWARTGCQFDGSGRGKCQTGDCGGLLQCQAYGAPPNTLVEYALNQFQNFDFFDISLVDGFNVPMEIYPTTGICIHGPKCAADINGQCPAELKAPGGCNNPCTVFKTDQYCCNRGSCGPTDYSKFFKDRCPDAYSYPKDDPTSTFTCPGETRYRVVFCP